MKLSLMVLLVAAATAWTAEVHSFSLVPTDGSIFGAPGDTIGWGYSIENQSTTHWLVTAGVVPGSFQFGTPDIIFDFPILAPGASVTIPFDATTTAGLLALTWDASAPPGTVESGILMLNAEWWTGDPFAGGQFALGADTLSQSYRATVVPEPGTSALVGLALFGAGVRWRWRVKA